VAVSKDVNRLLGFLSYAEAEAALSIVGRLSE
jgi:hypothetical protein